MNLKIKFSKKPYIALILFLKYSFIFLHMFLFFTIKIQTYAQSDTSYKESYLPEVLILDQKWELNTLGHETLSLDSIKQKIFFNQRVSDWIQNEGLFYIKNYGLGQLNTISYRGNTANQSQILWNGVPIQSPFNATPDYSQIPVLQMNISLLRGSNPSLWGSGSGSHLFITPNWKSYSKIHILQQLGSFGLNQQSVFVQPTLKKHTLQLQTYRLYANNHFTYINREKRNSPLEQLEHAQTLNYGFQLNYKTVFKKNILQAHIWKHRTQTQIPPVLTADTSAQNQLDDNLRLQIVYQTFFKKIKFSSQQTYLKDYLYYEDSIAQIFSSYLSHQWFSDHYFQYSNHQNFLQIQMQNHWIFPYAQNSMVLPHLWKRHAFLITYQSHSQNQKWHHQFTVRQENIQQQWIFPILNFSAKWNFLSSWYFKMSTGNSYRYPSLNDLYWQIGGNPNLKPEKGFQYESTIGYQSTYFQFQLTYYAGHYQNLIIWLPQGAIWTAQNLNQTYTNGIEFFAQSLLNLSKHQLKLEFQGFYGQSILNKPRFENDEAYRKQLIYQPKYRWSFQLSWTYKQFIIHYQHLWNGYVYYTSDNSEWLPDFQIANCTGLYHFKLRKHTFSIQLQIKNLWNTDYQVVKNRPMPGRNFLIGIEWKW